MLSVDSVKLSDFLNPTLLASAPYSIDAPKVKVKLDQNESPFDWPQEVKARILQKVAEKNWNRYPQPYPFAMEEKMAARSGVGKNCLLFSPGSNLQIVTLMNMLWKKQKGKLVVARPSFALYESNAQYEDFPFESWNLTQNMEYDLNLLPKMPSGSVLFFASPNNPPGNYLPRKQLVEILDKHPHSFIVVDEAYFEFAPENYASLLSDYPNLILLRTFSKAMGGSGVRVGYCLAQEKLIEQLRKITVPYMLNHFTLACLEEALSSSEMQKFIAGNIAFVLEERGRMFKALNTKASQNNWEIFPSSGNFFLFRWPTQEKAVEAYQQLQNRGILLRNVSHAPGLAGCLRVTIGNKNENDFLLASI